MRQQYVVVIAGTVLAAAAVLAVAAVRPSALAVGRIMRVEDFGAYWTGTVVNRNGQNAYDPANLAPLQSQIEPDRPNPLPAWSPPWTFAALTPLAGLSFPAARWVWLVVQFGTVFGAVVALWRVYGGPPDRVVTGWAAALLWYPTLQTLGLGQHSSLVLLGVVGWLAGLAAGRPALAGAALALVLVKPQNWHLLGLLVAVWAVDRRAWTMVAGGLAAAVVLTAAAAVPNPAVFDQYRDALVNRPPAEMIPPTLGSVLRMAFGPQRFWLAFLPAVAAQGWGLWYYARHRRDWAWADRLPVVLFVSYLTSPYGWVYDQILFLVPLARVLAAASAKRPAAVTPILVAVTAVTAVCLTLYANKFEEYTFLWLAPLSFGLYVLGERFVGR